MKHAIILAAVAMAVLLGPVRVTGDPARSRDGRSVAWVVPRGKPVTLATEIWLDRGDGNGAARIATFPGRPGMLSFSAGEDALLYREIGLSHPLYGSHLIGGRARSLVSDRTWRIGLDGTASPAPDEGGDAFRDAAEVPRDRVRGDREEGVGSPPDPRGERVLQDLGRALGLFALGYQASHRGDFSAEKRDYEESLRIFETLAKRSAPGGIPFASLSAYAGALRDRIRMPREARLEEICREHLLLLGDMLSAFQASPGRRLPASLEELRSWILAASRTRTTDPALRTRDLETLAQVMRCPSDPDSRWPIPYLYRGDGGIAGLVLSCLCHRGLRLDLTGGPDGFRITSDEFTEAQVDSLRDAGRRGMRSGAPDSAVILLSIVAHQRPRAAEAHADLGEAAFQAGDPERAEASFRTAASLSRGPVTARAYLGLGKIAMARPKGYLTAIDYCREALIQDPGFLEARFQMARARLLLQEYDARADLETVLRMDPGRAEAYLLMGNWYADLKEEYDQAIPWYARYLAMRPDDPEGRRRMSLAYLKVKDYDRVVETLADFVRAHPDAVEVMPIVAQACVRQDKLDMALGFYRSYLTGCDPAERQRYVDITPIASKEEAEEYARTSGPDREAFLKRFWNGRDPDLSTPVNERLLEHYRRVWYSRQNFSGGRTPWDRRGDVYVRFGEPDQRATSATVSASPNLAVQRIKERMALETYGTQAIGETYLGPVFPVRSMSRRDPRLDLNDQQTEYTLDPQMDRSQPAAGTVTRVEEATTRELGNSENQAQAQAESRRPGTRTMPTAAAPGASPFRMRPEREDGDPFDQIGFRPVSVAGPDVSTVPWESWVYTRIGEGIEITFTDEGANGVYEYAPVPMDAGLAADQMVRFSRYSPKRLTERAMSASPDHYTPRFDGPSFPFHFDVADFRGREGRTALEVYFGMPRSAARYLPAEDVTRMVVERQAALLSTEADTVFRSSGELVYQVDGEAKGEGAFVPDVLRLELPAGAYRMEVKARDRMTGRLGLYRKELRVEAYGRDRLQVSDLELAWRVSEDPSGGKFGKEGLQVIPMPTRTYRRGQNVFAYYEIYNLRRDGEGQTRYQVETTIAQKERGILSRLVRTFVGRREEVAVGYEGRGSRETEASYRELDLREFGAGSYLLRLTVTDLNGGGTAGKEAQFTVLE